MSGTNKNQSTFDLGLLPTNSPEIKSFKGKWFFLSNFSASPLTYEGINYPTIEHAFQAAKTLSVTERQQVADCASPGDSKRMGRQIHLRGDWEQVKESVMEELLTLKFADPVLADKLRSTGDLELIEINDWHDQTWGSCTCEKHKNTPGKNMLGVLLTKVRSKIAS
jgi:ribA/ribD-fused uncharacterized protein